MKEKRLTRKERRMFIEGIKTTLMAEAVIAMFAFITIEIIIKL